MKKMLILRKELGYDPIIKNKGSGNSIKIIFMKTFIHLTSKNTYDVAMETEAPRQIRKK